MALPDIAFTDANINTYQDIPSSIYPALQSTSIGSVTANHPSIPPVNGIFANGIGISIKWQYPSSDNLFIRCAVGYQFQVILGRFDNTQLQGITPPASVVYEDIQNFHTNIDPVARYINLQNGAPGQVTIPSTVMKGGASYTVRVRALLFSELGAGTVSGQYFKYTPWGSTSFSINQVPFATNLRVNSISNPTSLPSTDPVAFSFTFMDTDGPQYLYQIQVGTTAGMGFSANIWDSGLVNSGAAFSSRDFTVPYSGPALSPGVTYAWRVGVQDGLIDGGFTAANDTFMVNVPPKASSLKINGKEMLFNAIPTVGDTGAVLTWTFSDANGDTQRAYNLVITNPLAPLDASIPESDVVNTGNVFSTASTFDVPDLSANVTYQVQLSLRDATEFGPVAVGSFAVNAHPQVLNFRVDGEDNPGDVATTTPTFSWVFFDNDPGDSQQAFQIQVSMTDTFSTLLWDTGTVVSSANIVAYGSTASPVVAPVPLAHGSYFYARVRVFDGVSFSDYANEFFAINTKPGSPMLLTPTASSFSGMIDVTWLGASPLDADGDTVMYTIEVTNRRSSNAGWEYLAGPFNSSVLSFEFDTSNTPAGNDFGIRVIANDGFADSDPTPSTSPIGSSGLGFTIMNHAPITPTFVSPLAGDVVASTLSVQWVEADPVDIDGDSVFYVLELTRDSSVAAPTYENVGVFNEGIASALLDVSEVPDGTKYRLRITANDSAGSVGQTVYSPVFSVVNTPTITDFERLGGVLYIGTSDGRVFRASEAIWDVDNDFSTKSQQPPFKLFSEGSPHIQVANGMLMISSPSGSTFMLRIAPNKQ